LVGHREKLPQVDARKSDGSEPSCDWSATRDH
jgi:hypothetical protein